MYDSRAHSLTCGVRKLRARRHPQRQQVARSPVACSNMALRLYLSLVLLSLADLQQTLLLALASVRQTSEKRLVRLCL